MTKTLEWILILVIVGATLAFGGVQPLAYSLAEAGLFLAVLLLLLKLTREGKIGPGLTVWPLWFVLWVIHQTIPLPPRLVTLLSPGRLGGIGLSASLQAPASWITFSVNPHETISSLIKFLACLGAFTLAAYLFDSRKGLSNLIRGLIALGCFEAAYGIVQYLTGWQKIFWYTKQYDLEEATGTYINRNHFAGLLELVVPLAFSLAFYSFQRWSGGRQDGHWRNDSGRASASLFQSFFYLILLLLLMVAMIFSKSRGGILAALFSLIFLGLLTQLKIQRRAWAVLVFVVMAAVIGYGLWIGLGPVLVRFETLGGQGYLRSEGRQALWRDTAHLIRDFPLVGAGLGNFKVAFRGYQTGLVNNLVDHTHNDYLEFASETGLIGAALLFLPIFCLLIKMIAFFLRDPRRFRSSIILGCVGSILALLIHSATDFNLQIPANALIFAVMLGIGYKAACVEPRAHTDGDRRA